MNDVMGIINMVENSQALNEITLHRPLATVPFGGRYRLIDFALSGMVNSGVTNVGILAPFQQRSLLDHLRSGKDWRLSLKKDGLAFLPPSYGQTEHLPESDIRNLYSNLDFLKKSRQEHVIITSPNVVGNLEFSAALASHRQSGAEITFLHQAQEAGEVDCGNHLAIEVDDSGRVTRVGGGTELFTGTFILGKELLIRLIREAYSQGRHVHLLQGIGERLAQLDARAFRYPGYLARVHCLPSYYRHNMALLDSGVWQSLFAQSRQIYTKYRDEAPAKYGRHAEVAGAVVAGSCFIRGLVESSVLFRQVTVGERAKVRHSVLMSGTEVGPGAELSYVICDKDVRIGAGRVLTGKPDQPLVFKKGAMV